MHQLTELAAAKKIDRSNLCRVLRLTLLVPGVVETILDGRRSDSRSCSATLPSYVVRGDANRPGRIDGSSRVKYLKFRRSQERNILGIMHCIAGIKHHVRKTAIRNIREGVLMTSPEWLKPALYGAGVGAAAIAIAGFSWGGWVTGGTAQKMADDQARAEVVAALVPICLEQSRLDPNATEKVASLMDESSYKRGQMLMDTGWATMPGSADPNRNVANACMEALAAKL